MLKDHSYTMGFVTGGAAMAAALASFHLLSKRKDDHQASDLNATSTPSFQYTLSETDGREFRSNTEEEIRTYHYEAKMEERMKQLPDTPTKIAQTRSVTVRVPATTANLGPGFDTIGMALDMWTEITVQQADKFELTNEGEGADHIPTDESNLVVMGLKKAFEFAGLPVPPLKYRCVNRIPFARGLGSSSAAIVGGILAGLVLSGHTLKMWGAEELFNIASEIEGHPDNVAPAIYGGIQIGIHGGKGDRWRSERVNLPTGLQAVVFIPKAVGKTSDARCVLPESYSREEIVFNIGRMAWLVNALASNNVDNLIFGVEDKIHQPQRGAHVYKHLNPMIQAACEAGASCCYLSGAGPSVLALTTGASGEIFAQREKERVDRIVANAMLATAATTGVAGEVFITEPVLRGAHVAHAEPAFSTPLVRYAGDV